MLKFYEFGDMKNAANYDRTVSILGYIYCALYIAGNFYLYYSFYCYYIDYKWLMFISHELWAIACVEWMWYNTQRIHNPDEERDASFPAFRRPETKPWNKWLLYPAALSGIMTYRFWTCLLSCPVSACISNIVLFGYE